VGARSWHDDRLLDHGRARRADRVAVEPRVLMHPGRLHEGGVRHLLGRRCCQESKMVQRFVITEVIRRSFAAGRNADIVGAYTQLIPGAAATTWTGPSATPPPEDDLRRGFGGTGTGNGHKAAR